MTDFSFILALLAVAATAVLGTQFALPPWFILAVAATSGSLLSSLHKLASNSTNRPSVKRILLDIVAGGISGIGLAKLSTIFFGLPDAALSWMAFFMGHLGALVSKRLSDRDGEVAESLLSRLFGRLSNQNQPPSNRGSL